MKIAILATGETQDKWENKNLLLAAKKRGHEIEFINLLGCSISICSHNPKIRYKGERIDHKFDVIIPRIDTPHVAYGLSILQQFQALGVFVTDRASAISIGHNKLECLQYLMQKNIPFPKTGHANSKEDFDRILNTVGGVPLIAKLLEGTQGIGVFLADDLKHAKNILKTFKELDAPVIVQEFIEESSGEDIRAFVIDGKVVAAMKRQSMDGDFRANISLGGTSEQIELTTAETDIALRATQAIEANIAGVDIVRSNRGPLILEINTAPDFSGPRGLDEVTGIDIAGLIIDYAVRKKESHNTGNKTLLKKVA